MRIIAIFCAFCLFCSFLAYSNCDINCPTSSRTGARCKDGASSTATGSGACSGHGGVSCWECSITAIQQSTIPRIASNASRQNSKLYNLRGISVSGNQCYGVFIRVFSGQSERVFLMSGYKQKKDTN